MSFVQNHNDPTLQKGFLVRFSQLPPAKKHQVINFVNFLTLNSEDADDLLFLTNSRVKKLHRMAREYIRKGRTIAWEKVKR